ncbi:hypothetical protein ENUP19_0041G0037 [Entamoeba nuttalli]|uniref:Uncharacterized protein n=1 Tax=Entamoeba nuttalli TaxID=412467 RepID=A0ABQ0DA32_9EUKA
MSSLDNVFHQYISQSGQTEIDYPYELLLAIQMHFNKKMPLQFIEEALSRNNNDLYLSLKDINESLESFPPLNPTEE